MDELHIQETLDLFLDCGYLFVGHFLRFLLLWFGAGADVEAVLGYVPADTLKVTCRPSKDIFIFV